MTSAGVTLSHKWLKPAQAALTAQPTLGIQAGDVTANSAVIWARGERESRLVVDFSTSPTFEGRVQIRPGPQVLSLIHI